MLVADRAGGRTVIRRQHVGYPLHVTRPFALDRERPDLATLYLQSAAGGLYAGDHVTLELTVGAGASLNLTTQAATVVHDGRGIGAAQDQVITVKPGGFCAIVSDPFILFPGARLNLDTTATVADDAVLLIADGFAVHDPARHSAIFDRFTTSTCILRPDGRILLSDRASIAGSELTGSLSAHGGYAAAGTVQIIAPPDRRPDPAGLEATLDRTGCLAGASIAPNDAGIAIRLLAPDAGALARGIEAAFHVAAKAALGVDLARRRK